MGKYNDLVMLRNTLKDNLKTLESHEDLSSVENEVGILNNRIEQLNRYAKLIEFNQELYKLFEARLNAKSIDEARKIDKDMEYFVLGKEYFFSARYRNEIAMLDKEFYKEIKSKFGVSLVSPERFNNELKQGRFIDSNGQVQNITLNDQLLKQDNNSYDDTPSIDNNLNNNQIEWDPRLTEEQIADAKSRDIYEPVGDEYEQFLNEMGLSPIKDDKSDEPKWDPRLTKEQIADAKSRDIYEPVGDEYEQFLNEMGLSPLKDTKVDEPVINEEPESIVDVPTNTDNVNKEPEFKEEIIYKELPEDKQQTMYYGISGLGHLSPEEQFKKELNMDFDPNIYEIVYDTKIAGSNVLFKIVEKYEKETRIVPVLNNQLLLEDKQIGQAPLAIEDKHQIPLGIEDKQIGQAPLAIEDKHQGQLLLEDKQMKNSITNEEQNIVIDNQEVKSNNNIKTSNSLESILRNITLNENGETLDLTTKERKRITKGKICVTQNLKERVNHGNWIYNVLGATSALIPAAVQTITKLTNMIYTQLHPQVKYNHDQIVENLYKLSEDDLEVLRTELTNNKAVSLRSYSSIMPLVYNRLQVYVEEKYNEPLRIKITEIELELQRRYREIYALKDSLENAQSKEEYDNNLGMINNIVSGSAGLISDLMDMKNTLAVNIEGGPGVHTFGEGSKSVDNYMNDRGHFFAKRKGLAESEEFNKNIAEQADYIKRAISEGNDFNALYGYINKEMYELNHTQESLSLAGRVSSGEFQWKAMPESLNYGNDPLLGYVFTTISTLAIAKGIVSEIHNMKLNNSIDDVNKHNAEELVDINGKNAANQQANIHNQETIENIHNTGKNLENNSDRFVEGINQMSKDSVVSNRTAGEYNAGDATNWSFNSEFHKIDQASHQQAHDLYDQANLSFDQIQKGIQNGSLDSVTAMEQARNILSTMNSAKHSTYQQFLETINKYASNNPKFDYVPLENYMNNIVNNPNAIDAMVDGMTQSIREGRTLQEAVFELYNPIVPNIQGIPSDIESFVIPLITQAAITGYLNRLNDNMNRRMDSSLYNITIEKGLLDTMEYVYELDNSREETEETSRSR